ncbi:hypothetical protein BLOT_016031 [Blomia tropicalis]|nr:hypothetical protein BLOT_016031 [Blomia tropicalis]
MKRNKGGAANADERGPSSSEKIKLDSDLTPLANFHEIESNIKSDKSNATETTENPIVPPVSSKLKVDLDLKYTFSTNALEFNEINVVKHIKKQLEKRSYVDQFERETSYLFPYNMCMFASIVYNDYQDEGKSKYIKNLPKGWKLLTTAKNTSTLNGYFGATFWNLEREQVVIAHRGTEITNIGAVWTDIIGIYGNKVSPQMSSAVTFTHYVQQIFAEVDKERGTHFKILITGHSLGAWLAQVCTFSLKYLTIMDDNTYFVKSKREEGHHAHTVVFDSPGCKPMLQQLQREFDVRYDNVKKLCIDCLDITSYLSAPNRINTCNPHVGKIYRVFIDFDNESFLNEYNLYTHSLDNILETFDKNTGLFEIENGIFKIQEVVDWPETSILKGDEYNEFFEWAKKLNDYHPTQNDVKFKDYYPIRYQTKEFNKRQCSLNVFSQSEQQFLKQYQSVRQYPDFFNLNKLFNKEHLEILNKLSIDESNRLVNINKGSIVELYNTISYIRQLLIKYPKTNEILKTWLSKKIIVENLYKNVSISYLDMNKIWLKFKICKNIEKNLLKFLNNSDEIVWKVNVTSGDTFCTLKQIYNTFLEKVKNKSICKYTEEHCIVLDLKNILQTNCYIKMLDYVKLTKSYNQLLIIDYNPNQSDSNDDLIKTFFTNLFEEIKSSKSYKIILCAKQDHILENILSTNLEIQYIKKTTDKGFTWNDLDIKSQNKLLSRKIVFQEKEKNLNDLINEFKLKDKIDQLIDHTSLIKLIYVDNKIEIGSKSFRIENFEGAYADLFEEVNNETLKLNLVNNSINAIYFISGLYENNENGVSGILANSLNFEINIIADKTKYLKSPYILQSDNNKYIYLVDSQFKEDDFNKLCDKDLNEKKIFWIKWDKKKFILQRIYNPDFYIKRKFHKILVNIDKKMFETNDRFVFSGLDCVKRFSILFNDYSSVINKTIYIKPTIEDAKIQFNKSRGNVHLMEIETNKDDKQIVWRDSKRSIQNIRDYIENRNSLVDECSLINLIKDKQAIIFADDPGMGKSTTLVKLYHSKLNTNNIKVIESNFVIHVNFRVHIQTIKSYFEDNFNNINIDTIVNFLSKIDLKLSNNISQSLIKHLLKKGCIYKPILISFDGFDELPNSTVREKVIRLLKYLLNNTKAKIWITTRMHYCHVLEDTLSTFAIKFDPMDLQSIKLFILKYLEERFRLILDIKEQRDSSKSSLSGVIILIIYLILITWERISLMYSNFKNSLKKDCVVFANYLYFPSENNPINLENSKEKLILFGILKFEDNNFKFIHQTFKEYFFSEKLNDYKILRLFINAKLTRILDVKTDWQNSVYKECGNIIKTELQQKNKPLSMNQDGDTILNLAIIENNSNIVKFIINSLEMIEWESVKKFIGNKENRLKLTALHLTIKSKNVEIVQTLFALFFKNKKNLLNFVKEKDIKENFVLHLAVRNNNIDIVAYLLESFHNNKEFLIKLIKEKDINGYSAWHLAVKNNNVEIQKKMSAFLKNNKIFLDE